MVSFRMLFGLLAAPIPAPHIPRTYEITSIGTVHSPYLQKLGTPKQATVMSNGTLLNGTLEVFPPFRECLLHLQGFDFCWVITYMNRNSGFKTQIAPMPRPGAVNQPPSKVGLFASRAPHRPNPLALSALQITHVDVEQGIIGVLGLDLLDGTPIMDIKPYIPAFDAFPEAAAGWMDDIDGGNYESSRRTGYQQIVSKRGQRAGRAAARREGREFIPSAELLEQGEVTRSTSKQQQEEELEEESRTAGSSA